MVWRRGKESSCSAFSAQSPPPTLALATLGARLPVFFCSRARPNEYDLLVPVLKLKRVNLPLPMTAKQSDQLRSLDLRSGPSRWCLCLTRPSLAHGAPSNVSDSSSRISCFSVMESVSTLAAPSSRMIACESALANPIECLYAASPGDRWYPRLPTDVEVRVLAYDFLLHVLLCVGEYKLLLSSKLVREEPMVLAG
jgi:hypothetical protein